MGIYITRYVILILSGDLFMAAALSRHGLSLAARDKRWGVTMSLSRLQKTPRFSFSIHITRLVKKNRHVSLSGMVTKN